MFANGFVGVVGVVGAGVVVVFVFLPFLDLGCGVCGVMGSVHSGDSGVSTRSMVACTTVSSFAMRAASSIVCFGIWWCCCCCCCSSSVFSVSGSVCMACGYVGVFCCFNASLFFIVRHTVSFGAGLSCLLGAGGRGFSEEAYFLFCFLDCL